MQMEDHQLALYDKKKFANKNFRKFITSLRAKTEHIRIQQKDMVFTAKDKNRFKPPTRPATACKRVTTENGLSSDPNDIVNEFHDYFCMLASPKIDSNENTDTLSRLLTLSYTHPNSASK